MSAGNGTAVSSLAEVHLSGAQRDRQRLLMIQQINATTTNVHMLWRAVAEMQADRDAFKARTFWERVNWLLTGR